MGTVKAAVLYMVIQRLRWTAASQVALGSTSQPARGSSLEACPLEVLRDQTWRWTHCHTFLMERTNPWPPLGAGMAGGYHPTLCQGRSTDFVSLLRWLIPRVGGDGPCHADSHDLLGVKSPRLKGARQTRGAAAWAQWPWLAEHGGGSASISAHTCTAS